MATEENTNYVRINFIVAKCGKEVAASLLLKSLECNRPPGKPTDEPWGLNDFLQTNKTKILEALNIKRKDDAKKSRILFPESKDSTNLTCWDLQLVVWVLTKHCKLGENKLLEQDVKNIVDVRNKVCHPGDPKIRKDMFDHYMGRLHGAFTNILEFVGNAEKKAEVFAEVRLYEQMNLEHKMIFEVIEWNHIVLDEMAEMKEQIEHVKKGQADMMTTVQTEIERVQAREAEQDARQKKMLNYMKQCATSMSTKELSAIRPPVARMELKMKNCDEPASSSKMTTQFTEAMEQTRNGLVSHNGIIARIQDFFKWLIGGNKKINAIKDECVAFYIQCVSLEVLISLFEDILSGQMTDKFKPLEHELRKSCGYEKVELNAIIQESDFWQCMEDIVSQLEKIRSDTEAQRHPVDPGITDNPLSRIQLPINLSQSTTGETVIGFTVKSTTTEEALELTESIRNGSKQHVLDELTTRLREHFSMPNLELNLKLAEEHFDVSVNMSPFGKKRAKIVERIQQTGNTVVQVVTEVPEDVTATNMSELDKKGATFGEGIQQTGDTVVQDVTEGSIVFDEVCMMENTYTNLKSLAEEEKKKRRVKHRKLVDFTADKQDHSITEFYDKFGRNLPRIVTVSQGFFGDIVEDIFDRDQVIRLETVSRQKRVVAKSEDGNRFKLLSIPSTYPEKLYVVNKHGKLVGRERTINTIIKDTPLPCRVEFPKDKTISVGAQQISTNSIPCMELLQTFDEMYFLGNNITDGEMEIEVVHVPLYLSQLRVAEVTGINGISDVQWKGWLKELAQIASNNCTYDEGFGNVGIALYDPNALRSDKLHSYVQPSLYANILTLFAKQTPHKQTTQQKTPQQKTTTKQTTQHQTPLASKQTSYDAFYDPDDAYEDVRPPPANTSLTLPRRTRVDAHQQQTHTASKLTDKNTISSPTTTHAKTERVKQKLRPPIKPKPSPGTVAHSTSTLAVTEEHTQHQQNFMPMLPFPKRTESVQYVNKVRAPTTIVKPMLREKPKETKSEIRELTSPADVGQLTIDEVSEYLKRLKLDDYVGSFKEQRIDGRTLLVLDKDMLKEEFGMVEMKALSLLQFAQQGHIPI